MVRRHRQKAKAPEPVILGRRAGSRAAMLGLTPAFPDSATEGCSDCASGSRLSDFLRGILAILSNWGPEKGDGRHVLRPPGAMMVPAVPLWRRIDMSQKKKERGLIALALAVALSFASPVVADAAQRTGPVGLWGWMESLWSEGVSGWWRAESPVDTARGGEAPASQTKEGACIDPNGRCASLLTGGQRPVCGRFNDESACIDPDG
jgi:hypothetical protein